MSCHEENKEKRESHKHSPLKHVLHMALCCGLPIVIVAALPLITRFSPAGGDIMGKLAPFICPVMMLLMLPMMFRNNKKGSCCDVTKEYNPDDKHQEVNKATE